MNVYQKIANAKNEGEVLALISDLLEENAGRLASTIRQTSAEAANGICAFLRKRASTERRRHAGTVKKGRTPTETTYNEILSAAYHYPAEFTGADGFSEYGFLITLYLILIDYIDGSKGRTLEDLEAVSFAILARCRFLHKESENMAEALEHYRNETAGNRDKQN
ncbi:MAG: hypothetical protein IKX40_02690 [Thermoguttaceae bacterium]|nr:hypothetical protein [Thermoguttaceae bacterium]